MSLRWCSLACLLAASCSSTGAPGAPGAAGTPGAPGAAGTPGAPGAMGATGSPSGSPDALIAAPSQGFLGRSYTVLVTSPIGGIGSDAAADFGTGVTVSNVDVVSDAVLSATVAIDPSCAPGTRTFQITSGGKTLSGGFVVGTQLTLTTLAGSFTQGQLTQVDIANADSVPLSPPGVGGDGIGTFATGTGFAAHGDGANISGYILVAPNAPVGVAAFSIFDEDPVLGGPGDRFYAAGTPATVTAATPTTLALGTPLTNQPTLVGDQAVTYEVGSTGVGLVSFTFSATPFLFSLPTIAVFGGGGTMADLLTHQLNSSYQVLVTADEDLYLSVYDLVQAYTITATATTLTPIGELATAHAKADGTAQALTLPAMVEGAIGAAGELDVYSFPASTGTNYTLVARSTDDLQFFIGGPDGSGNFDVATANAQGGVGHVAGQANVEQSANLLFGVATSGTSYLLVRGTPGAPHPTGNYIFAIH